jgi:hypothetical protein
MWYLGNLTTAHSVTCSMAAANPHSISLLGCVLTFSWERYHLITIMVLDCLNIMFPYASPAGSCAEWTFQPLHNQPPCLIHLQSTILLLTLSTEMTVLWVLVVNGLGTDPSVTCDYARQSCPPHCLLNSLFSSMLPGGTPGIDTNICHRTELNWTPWLVVRKRTIPTSGRRLSAKLVPTLPRHSLF